MAEKNLDEQVDKLESAIDPNTVITIGGYKFTPAKIMIAGTIVTSILGGLYGAFEIYKDYMDMKQKIAEYVTPDLSEIYKKMEVLDTSTSKMTEYSESIKNDLKEDIRRLEGVVENVERSSKIDSRNTDSTVKEIQRYTDSTLKEMQRNTDSTLKGIKSETDNTLKEVRRYSDQSIKEMNTELTRNQKEITNEVRALRREIDDKIKKALDNPLAN